MLRISGSLDTLTSFAGANCAQAVVASLLADPHAPDTSCAARRRPPDFTASAAQ
ncbi:MAG: hypothetical protein J0I21_17950 [Alphaproteobacteria bacterium]|nr:hypothetical protein [Alphaproteobacteria bacterium]